MVYYIILLEDINYKVNFYDYSYSIDNILLHTRVKYMEYIIEIIITYGIRKMKLRYIEIKSLYYLQKNINYINTHFIVTDEVFNCRVTFVI